MTQSPETEKYGHGTRGPETKYDCAGEGQQQFSEHDNVDNSSCIESYGWMTVNNEVEGIKKEAVME
jgi:hypothetical protein